MAWYTKPSSGSYGLRWFTMTPDEEREVLAVLNSVGVTTSARCTATAWNGCPGDIMEQTYCGNIEWVLSNGWRVWVFNDCGDWDCIDSIEAPDGRRWEYPDGTEPSLTQLVANWQPAPRHERAWLDQKLPPHPATAGA